MSESNYLINTLRVRLKEIFDLERRLRELINRLTAAEFPGAPHAATHADGGADEVDVTDLGGFPGGGTTFLRDDGTFAAAGAGTPSATVADLDGTNVPGVATDYSRGDHKHGDTNRPTDDEKAALVGTGTPAAANPYVTEDTLAEAIAQVVGVAQNTFLVSGGQVVWIDDYDFIVSAATYYINGVFFSSPQTPITLDAADATNDRIDVIIVDDTGSVDFITGTPAAQPAEPDVDPSTQLKLAIVLVNAASTEPAGATTALVYAENAGSSAEWDWTSSGSGWNLASTNNPRTGTIDIEATTVSSGAFIQGEIGAGTFDPNVYSQLVLYIRSKANWTNNRTMQIRLQNAGVVVGATLTIGNGQYGFDSTITASYQQIAIPISQFAVPAGQVITQVRLTRAGGSTIGFYLDDVSFVGGAVTQPGTGITQEQADARYAPLAPGFVTIAAETGLPNERRLTAGTGISVTDGGPGSTVTIASSVTGGMTQLTGDVTAGPGSGSQAATIANNAVTDAKLRDSAALSVIGRSANSTGDPADIAAASDGQVMRRSGTAIAFGAVDLASANATTGTLPNASLTTAAKTRAIAFVIDGGGAVITTGVKGDLSIPFACTITGVSLLADQSGAIVIDIWKDTYANFPPTDSPDSITASAPPTITASGVKSEDTTLTGWTTSISAGDTLRFNVDSVTSIQRVTLTLTVMV